MSSWHKALDAAVSGQLIESMIPPHIGFLSLPPLSRWHGRTVEIDWAAHESVYQGSGKVFGGYLSALADYIAGAAMLAVLEESQGFATQSLEINYYRPVVKGDVLIRAEVTDYNENRAFIDVKFIAGGKTVAEAMINQAVYDSLSIRG